MSDTPMSSHSASDHPHHPHLRSEDALGPCPAEAVAAAAIGEGEGEGGPQAPAADGEAHAPEAATDTAATSSDAPLTRKAAPRKATAASRAAAIAAAATGGQSSSSGTAATPAPATRKRRLSMDGGAKTPKEPVDKKHAAAARIQALVRGAKARTAHKHSTLWNAWNELDWKEEAELMGSHAAYEALKKAVQDRKKADEAEEKKGGAAVGAAPRTPKKGKKKAPALSDLEAEAALGLVWRDKDPLTYVWVTQAMDVFKLNKVLPASLVFKLLDRVTPLLRALPNIVSVPVSARVTVVGDLHGQLDDLLAIFKLQGLPSARNRFIFNGDFVDRGQWSCECVLTLLAWKLLLPGDVFLNRGNHEARDINGRDGFERECHAKYGREGARVFDAFSACFACLPLVSVIEQQVWVTHGGLYEGCPSVAEIAAEDRFHEVPPSGSLMELGMWSDPKTGRGRSESPRGAGLLFGPDVTKEFLAKNQPLNLIVRSHECMPKGFKLHHHDSVITVFSASNYTGSVGNDGALIVFERDGGTVLGTPRPPPSPRAGPVSPSIKHTGHGHTMQPAAVTAAAAASVASTAPIRTTRHTRESGKQNEVRLQLPPSSAAAAAAVAVSSSPPVVSLKRSIVTFYASAKEKHASYRVMPESHLQTDIVAKLLHMISDRRLALIDYWSSRSQQHSSGVRTVTRSMWATGLKSVLGLQHMPFHEAWFQELLGLPKLGVDGRPKGAVDFMAFLLRFRPVNLLVLKAQRAKRDAAMASQMTQESQETMVDGGDDLPELEASPDEDETLASLQEILSLLHTKRFELESLFRFLDSDGDEQISHEEFTEGLHALKEQLGATFTRKQIEALLKYIDVDGDGYISYAEFFNSFELSDPKFACTLQRSKSMRQREEAAEGEAATHAPAGSLSPQHADDESPPRSARFLNPANDHDDTSSSHMHHKQDEEEKEYRPSARVHPGSATANGSEDTPSTPPPKRQKSADAHH